MRTILTSQHLFDFEIEKLRAKELARYADDDRFRKDLPPGFFLLVPPQPKELDLDHMVSLIEIDGKKGQNCLDPEEYALDKAEIPKKPYLMLDVKDGGEWLNVHPQVSKVRILRDGRLPYTIWRGIIHVIVFPEVLKSHNTDLVDSPGMPFLCLYRGEPRLDSYRYLPYIFPGWGAPSCGSIRF